MQQPPVLDDRDAIEARTLLRRQVLEAFLAGAEVRPEPWDRPARRGIVLGVAAAVLVAVVTAIARLIDVSRARRGP